MTITNHQSGKANQFESVHVCPQCGTPIRIEDMSLREATTGIVNCPKCGWSGKIEIQIVRNGSTEKPDA